MQKIYLTYYNFLIAQGLWRSRYQVLPVTFLKKFIELNVNSQCFRDVLIEYKCLYCKEIYQRKFDEKLKERFLIHKNFLTTKVTSLSYCCKKMFFLMDIWMIEKNSMKHRYMKRKIFTVT